MTHELNVSSLGENEKMGKRKKKIFTKFKENVF